MLVVTPCCTLYIKVLLSFNKISVQSIIECKSGGFLNLSGLEPIKDSSSGINTKDFKTSHEALNHEKNNLEHNVSDMSKRLAKSLFNSPNLIFINIIRTLFSMIFSVQVQSVNLS